MHGCAHGSTHKQKSFKEGRLAETVVKFHLIAFAGIRIKYFIDLCLPIYIQFMNANVHMSSDAICVECLTAYFERD